MAQWHRSSWWRDRQERCATSASTPMRSTASTRSMPAAPTCTALIPVRNVSTPALATRQRARSATAATISTLPSPVRGRSTTSAARRCSSTRSASSTATARPPNATTRPTAVVRPTPRSPIPSAVRRSRARPTPKSAPSRPRSPCPGWSGSTSRRAEGRRRAQRRHRRQGQGHPGPRAGRVDRDLHRAQPQQYPLRQRQPAEAAQGRWRRQRAGQQDPRLLEEVGSPRHPAAPPASGVRPARSCPRPARLHPACRARGLCRHPSRRGPALS